MNYCTASVATLTLALLLITYLTAARWLQQRSAWLGPLSEVDAVYIVAGAPKSEKRIGGVLDWACEYDCRPPTILVAEDPISTVRRLGADERIPVAVWQVERLTSELMSSSPHSNGRAEKPCNRPRCRDIIVVPGLYYGTDGEMQALAKFLDQRPDLRRVALATSRSHVRRALGRAHAHIGVHRIFGAIPGQCDPDDFTPRLVFTEAIKLVRDRIGMSQAPALHRAWWFGQR